VSGLRRRSATASEALPRGGRRLVSVVGARVEPGHPVVELGACGEDEDRHVAGRAQALQDLHAIELRKPQIQDHEVRHEFLRELQCLKAVVRRAHLMALLAQGAPEDLGNRLVVLDHEDTAHRSVAGQHLRREGRANRAGFPAYLARF
jgi:hypothetical protein